MLNDLRKCVKSTITGRKVQHCRNTGEKSQRQTERNQRTSDEGETTKSENERANDLEKTIDVDEALQDFIQNSQQENESVIIQEEIIEGSQRVARSYNKIKNKKQIYTRKYNVKMHKCL